MYEIKSDYEKKINIINIKNNIIDDKLYNDIKITKNLIDNYSNDWEKFKKYYNNYEYIYYSTDKKKNICNHNESISRAFYKLHEILYEFKLNNNTYENISCIAEGPGGFIQSILYNIDNIDNIAKITGITLESNDKSIPKWSPIIEKNNNIKIVKGRKKNGDICDMYNLISIINEIGENKNDLITCDGGIDYSKNYNNQELDSYELLYCEILYCLITQKLGGTMIIKMFDIIYYSSYQLLYILYICYDNIKIYKPSTSRKTNSEKYIICRGYKNNKDIIKIMKNYFNNKKSLFLYIPSKFIEDIKQYNSIQVKNQLKTINYILNKLKKKEKKYKPDKEQITNAINWCKKYNMEINNNCIYLKL